MHNNKYAFFVIITFLISIFIPSITFGSKKEHHNEKKEETMSGHDHQNKNSGHQHNKTPILKSHNNTLTAKDIDFFLKTFNPVEKELNKLNVSQFTKIEIFKDTIENSAAIANLLQKQNATQKQYISIYKSITAAYNELKMVRFEQRIKSNQHEKFIYRKELMLDHESADHKKLHEMQKENFKEKFDPDGLLGSTTEPKENIMLVEKHELLLDKLFKN